MARIHTQALASAYVVSTQMKWIVGSSRQALREIDGLVGAAPAALSDSVKKAIREVISGMPVPAAGRVIGADGRAAFATEAGHVVSSAAGHPYFEELRLGKAEQYVSSLIVDDATSAQQFAVAHRLQRDGAFAGVLANNFKHAFADGRRGLIRIALTACDGHLAELRVSDNGIGFDPTQDSKGIGSRLIRGLVQQLGGNATTTTNGGTHFTLRLAPRRTVA